MKKTTAFLLCAILTGCTVGPKYHPPAVQPPPAFKEAPPASPATPPANAPVNPPGDQAQDNGNWTVAQPAAGWDGISDLGPRNRRFNREICEIITRQNHGKGNTFSFPMILSCYDSVFPLSPIS